MTVHVNEALAVWLALSFTVAGVLMAGATLTTAYAKEWQALAGVETPIAEVRLWPLLPNELWIHSGDRIRWTFPAHERDILTLLQQPG